MALVEVDHLVKTYPVRGSRQPRRVVDDVTFRIERGQTLGIVGEWGSGKSTIARLLLRLIEPDSGAIRLDGHNLLTVSPRELRQLRRRMQIVFQDPYAALNPRMRVEDIIAEPLVIYREEMKRVPQVSTLRPGVFSARSSFTMARRAQVVEALAMAGLDCSALPRYPHEFSGGQRQRINLARALILRPSFSSSMSQHPPSTSASPRRSRTCCENVSANRNSPTSSSPTPCRWRVTWRIRFSSCARAVLSSTAAGSKFVNTRSRSTRRHSWRRHQSYLRRRSDAQIPKLVLRIFLSARHPIFQRRK